jgi:hypothetical protein
LKQKTNVRDIRNPADRPTEFHRYAPALHWVQHVLETDRSMEAQHIGTATGSKSRAAFSGFDAVEIKVTIRPDQELRAERAMRVNEDTAVVRLIYFFDTPDLDLFNAGVALRARLVKGDADDTTVKIRSEKVAGMSPDWRELKGFKLEADWVGDHAVSSASLTQQQPRDEIEKVAEGKRAIEKLFTKDQERFLAAFYAGSVGFAQLRVLGPIRVLRWKLKHADFAHQMTVEEWRLPNGEDLVEVSIKTPPGKAHEARADFDAHLTALGLDPQGAQETKTRTALEYFAKVCKQA